MRTVESGSNDKVIPDDKVEQSLLVFFTGLSKNNPMDPRVYAGQSSKGEQEDNVGSRTNKWHVRSVEPSKRCRNLLQKLVASQYGHRTPDKKGCCIGGQTPTRTDSASPREQRCGTWSTGVVWEEPCKAGTLQSLHQRFNLFKRFTLAPEVKLETQESKDCYHQSWRQRRFAKYHKQYSESSRICHKPDAITLCTFSESISSRDFTTAVSSEPRTNHNQTTEGSRLGLEVMRRILGFTIERRPSSIAGGGTGVFVTHGTIPAETVVAMYPGK